MQEMTQLPAIMSHIPSRLQNAAVEFEAQLR